MAELTYTVTVASGNLYGGGTGNVFYLDGARNSTGPGTISWVQGATLRFEQSDSSNDFHPLIFSTNTSTSGIISSGVTYYLDGASNQSNYTNTTTFNAATTRYVEITPSSETDFYYLCYVHGIGMGGIFDITQDTWGAQAWSVNSWGNQDEAFVSPTAVTLATSLGSVAAFPNKGFGGLSYGTGNWGDLPNTQANVSGFGLQLSLNPPVAFPEQGWGGKQWGANLWGDLSNNSVIPTGNPLTISIGTETVEGEINQGWGRSTWGSNIWNGYGQVIPSSNSLSASVNSVTINGEINSGWGGEAWGENAWGIFGDVRATGNQLTISTESNQDAWGAGTWSDYNTRWGGTGSVDIGVFQEVSVTGQSLTLTQASATTEIAVEVFLQERPLSSLNTAVGTADPAPDTMPSGVQLATSLGTVQAYNEQGWGRDAWNEEVWGGEGEWADVSVTGQSLTVDSGVRESWGQDTWGASTTEWGGISVTDVDISVNVNVSTLFTPGWGAEIAWGAQSWGQASVDMSMTANEGTVDPAPDTSITGNQANSTTGTVSITANADLTLTGQQLTASLGNEDATPNTIASPTGVQLTTVMGVPTAGLSVLVAPTGVTSSFSTGTIGLNAWAIVDPGTAPTWTVVDKAA